MGVARRRRWRRLVVGLFAAVAAGALAHTSAGAAGVSLPTRDNPALPHGLKTLQQLAGSTPSRGRFQGDAQGVDVASFQHPNGATINWGQVAADGYRFVFVKATQGDYYVNPYFGEDYNGAQRAGLYRAAYHFADPSVSGGATQADYLLSAAPFAINGLTLPPALDVESVSGQSTCYGYSQAGMVAWIAAFNNEVQVRTGRLPIIYSNASWWNQCTGGTSAFWKNLLWVASYGSSVPTMPGGWATWAFWQYTSTGSVPGISGSTDLSSFPGSLTELAALAGNVVSSWSPVSGSMSSGPAVASWAWNREDAFARGQDGALYHWVWTSGGWGGPERLGGGIAAGTGPAAVAWGSGRLDVFVVGLDGELWHMAYWGGWTAWQPLGGGLASSPSVASWGPGRLDIFARGLDHGLWHMAWDNGWSTWQGLGGALASAPGVGSWGFNRLDIFVDGPSSAMWHMDWAGAWSGWESLGGVLGSAPAASSWGPGRLDVVVLGPPGTSYHRFYAGGWSAWASLGGVGTADPAIMDRASGLVAAFVRGQDNELWSSPVPP